MRLHVSAVLRAAAEFQLGAAAVGAVIGRGDSGQFVLPVWKRKAIAERAVRTEFDLPSADGHGCVRFSGAVDNQLGVHVEPESLLALHAAVGAGEAGYSAAPRAGLSDLRCGLR